MEKNYSVQRPQESKAGVIIFQSFTTKLDNGNTRSSFSEGKLQYKSTYMNIHI